MKCSTTDWKTTRWLCVVIHELLKFFPFSYFFISVCQGLPMEKTKQGGFDTLVKWILTFESYCNNIWIFEKNQTISAHKKIRYFYTARWLWAAQHFLRNFRKFYAQWKWRHGTWLWILSACFAWWLFLVPHQRHVGNSMVYSLILRWFAELY